MNDTRDHIIQVAERLFLQSNYDGVSIHDITRAVGMTKGALYHHFTSKEQLFEEVANSLVKRLLTDFSALPKESLRGFYCKLAENLVAREESAQEAKLPNILDSGINFYNLLWDAMRLLPGFRASMESFNALELSAWTEAIQAAIDRGEIRRGLDANRLARIFTSVADGVGITSMQKGGQHVMYGEILGLWETLYQSLKI
jgi:TetR/AcrR family transcriptional regulator, transcriptional repressor for nem operon